MQQKANQWTDGALVRARWLTSVGALGPLLVLARTTLLVGGVAVSGGGVSVLTTTISSRPAAARVVLTNAVELGTQVERDTLGAWGIRPPNEAVLARTAVKRRHTLELCWKWKESNCKKNRKIKIRELVNKIS